MRMCICLYLYNYYLFGKMEVFLKFQLTTLSCLIPTEMYMYNGDVQINSLTHTCVFLQLIMQRSYSIIHQHNIAVTT